MVDHAQGKERALGFISSSRLGGAQSLVRGALKGEKGLKFDSTVRTRKQVERGGERERGKGPPFWNVNDGVFWFLLGDIVDPKRGKNRGGVI